MTGLKPDSDLIIEIATIVTDKHLTVLAEGPVLRRAPERIGSERHGRLEQKSAWAFGLAARVLGKRHRCCNRRAAHLGFSRPRGSSPNARRCAAIAFARIGAFWRATCRHWRTFFHYRNLDVSTLKELALALGAECRGGVSQDLDPSWRWTTCASRSASCSITASGCCARSRPGRYFRATSSFARNIQVSTTVSGFNDRLSMPCSTSQRASSG